ncbi:MAG: peptidyl-tRNA hydrolase [Acidimicrobiales bacterium]
MSEERPWAMQLAARVEKIDPPPVDAIWEAAILATVGLLADGRSCGDGPWAEAVDHWNGRRIRKIVRRARGAAWERAQAADGVTVHHRGAEVRAFVPCPVDAPPAEVARLQIQSTPLDEPDADRAEPTSPGTLVVTLTPEVEMSWGKRAAQSAHAGQWAWMRADDERRATWAAAGRPVRVHMAADSTAWADAVDAATVEIHDGGFTEIAAGTKTAVARWSP